MPEIVRLGNASGSGQYAMRLLNKARRRARQPALVDHGAFDARWVEAARDFQRRHPPLSPDGVVGPRTFAALGHREEHSHLVTPFGQPTGVTCWSAAATIILGDRSVGGVSPGTRAGGGLEGTPEDHEAFARSLGWRMLDHSPNPVELANLLRRTPLWVRGGGSNWAHAFVLSAFRWDGDPRGDAFQIRIHDPWPPGRGAVYVTYVENPQTFASDGVTVVPFSFEYVIVPR